MDIYPAVNPLGINTIQRGVPLFDLDMNRIFPGDTDGPMAEYYAHEVVEDMRGADIAIDIHASNIYLRELPQVRIMNTGYQTASLGNLFGLPYVVMRKPTPIDTTTLNYNWQIWETNAFSIYTKETDEVDEKSAQEAVAAVLRYLSRVGLLRYNCHSGYLSSVVQENEMSNVLTPAGGIFRRFVEPGQEVEYGQKLGVILDPFTAEVEAEITCPTSGVVFFALKKPLTTEHEVAFKVIRRLHGGCL